MGQERLNSLLMLKDTEFDYNSVIDLHASHYPRRMNQTIKTLLD